MIRSQLQSVLCVPFKRSVTLRNQVKGCVVLSLNDKSTLKLQCVNRKRDFSTLPHTDSLPTAPAGFKMTLNIKLPDLSVEPQLPGPHIPFLPDFWDSSRARGEDAIRHDADQEAPMRQVLVVGGTSLQHAEGPTYGSSEESESTGSHAVPNPPDARKSGIWADVIEDLGLPANFSVTAPLIDARDTILESFTDEKSTHPQRRQSQPRPLTADEAIGLWALLLIVSGSWLAGGLFGPPKKSQHD